MVHASICLCWQGNDSKLIYGLSKIIVFNGFSLRELIYTLHFDFHTQPYKEIEQIVGIFNQRFETRVDPAGRTGRTGTRSKNGLFWPGFLKPGQPVWPAGFWVTRVLKPGRVWIFSIFFFFFFLNLNFDSFLFICHY